MSHAKQLHGRVGLFSRIHFGPTLSLVNQLTEQLLLMLKSKADTFANDSVHFRHRALHRMVGICGLILCKGHRMEGCKPCYERVCNGAMPGHEWASLGR